LSWTDAVAGARRARAGGPELRRFGLIVGGVFAAIGVWPLAVRGLAPRPWALGLAAGLILPALLSPRLLAPAHRVWMALAEALGWLNTRILLSIVFFGLVTPMGAFRRALGHDPMRRALDPGAATYRVTRPRRPPTHMTRQF
jgi:hypothetical protein